MREAVGAVLDGRAPGPTGLSRAIKWSFGIHLGVAVVVLAWQAFLAHSTEQAAEMTISLAGPPGPATGGLTALGGRQVDLATPPTKRPDPTVPAAKPDEPTVPTKSPARPAAVKRDATTAQSSVVTPPATGRQVATGSSVVETGARGDSVGLAQGGGATSRVDPLFEFCCQAYLTTMKIEMINHVTWAQENHGTVVVRFEVRSDGTIDPASVKVDKSSSYPILDTDALKAVRSAHLPPLPKEYKGTSLTVFLTVPY